MEEETNLGSPKFTMRSRVFSLCFRIWKLHLHLLFTLGTSSVLIGYWPADHNRLRLSSEQAHCHHFSCAISSSWSDRTWIMSVTQWRTSLSAASGHCTDDHIWLAVLLGSVGSPVTRMGSGGGRDSFLGAAERKYSTLLWRSGTPSGWREPTF